MRVSLPLLSAILLIHGPAFAGDKSARPVPPQTPVPAAPAEIDHDAAPGSDESSAIVGRIQWLREGRVGADGLFPANARLKAYQLIDENLQNGLLGSQDAAIPGSYWTPIGPAPASGNTGRVTAVAIDPTNSSIVYVGGATGGVWKTTDAGATWATLTDTQASLAIGAIAIAPSDRNTIYVGTGEANSSCDSYYGAGILKSTDGGANWTLLANATFNAHSISRIVIHPTNPLIAWASVTTGVNGSFICSGAGGSNTGIWKTINGGTSWTRGTNALGAADRVVIDPANSNILYGAFKSGAAAGFRKSIDGGASFTNLAGGLPSVSGRADITIRASDGNLFATYDNATNGGSTWRSVDAGVSWTATPAAPSNLCNGYCWYFIGVESAPDGSIWLRGFNDFRSADNGASWTNVTSAVHVDHHAIAFGTASTVVWVGSDGGAYRSANIAAPSWTNVNTGLQIMQFYPGASVHPSNANYTMGGSQDNGTNRFTGTSTWTQVFGGDGCWTAIDQGNPAVQFASYQYLMIQRSLNSGASFSQTITGLADSNNASNAPFIGAFEMCPGNTQHLIAGSITIWKTVNQATLWTANSPTSMAGGSKFNALAWSRADATCNTYFAGSVNGQVWRTTVGGGTAAANWTNISAGLPGRGIQDFAVLPTDGNTVFVGLAGFSANVWRSTNALSGAPTWTNISIGLPAVPVNAVLIDPADNNYVYIGTDAGIFRSSNALSATPVWAAFSTGMPKVPIFDLIANAATSNLIAFTHGRGAWRLATVAPGEAGISTALTLSKSGGNLVFNWGAPGGTCGAVDTGVYRGNLSILRTIGYTHNTALNCAGAGTTFSIPINDALLSNTDYFLVTASNGVAEGSYGHNSSGVDIPVSNSRCRATQTIAACP